MIRPESLTVEERNTIIDLYEEYEGSLWPCTTYCENSPPRYIVLDAGEEWTDILRAQWERHSKLRMDLAAPRRGVPGKPNLAIEIQCEAWYSESPATLPILPPDRLEGVSSQRLTCRVCGGRARIYRLNDDYRRRRGGTA